MTFEGVMTTYTLEALTMQLTGILTCIKAYMQHESVLEFIASNIF